MSDPLNELLIIGPLIAKIQVANILDWVSPLFSNVIYRDGERDNLVFLTYADWEELFDGTNPKAVLK